MFKSLVSTYSRREHVPRIFRLERICALLLISSALNPFTLSCPSSNAQECHSLSSTTNAQAEKFEDAWIKDNSFSVIMRLDESNHKQYRITGDTILFDQEHFGSLARDRQQRFSDVSEVVIDARVLIFNGPLSLSSGRIKIFAEHIVFGPKAQITITDPPLGAVSDDSDSSDYDLVSLMKDGVAIVAQRIDFDHPLPYAFYFRTRPNRALIVSADQMFLNGQQIDQVDLYVPTISLGKPFAFHRAKARHIYHRVFHDEMNWPLSFATKVARFHAIAPYQVDYQKGLQDKIQLYTSQISEWRDPKPGLTLQRVSRFIEADQDPYGYGPDYVPRNDIGSQIEVVGGLLKQFSPDGPLGLFEKSILDGYQDKQPDGEALGYLNDQEKAASKDIADTNASMSQALTDLQSLQQTIDANLLAIKRSTERIDEAIKEQEKKDEDGARIARATNVVAVAASFIPVTAPLAIAIGTGAEVGGTLISKHQAGSNISIGGLIDLVQSGYAESEAFNDQVTNVKATWDDLSQKHSQLKEAISKNTNDRSDKLKAFGESSVNFYKSIKVLYGMTDVPSTVQYNASKAQQGDSLLQQQLNTQSQMSARQAELLMQVADCADKSRKGQGRILEVDDAREQLLRANVQNDQAVAHWQQVALAVRSDMYSQLFREASVLRRSIFYSTGAYPTDDADILSYADQAFVSGGDAQLADQTSPAFVKSKFDDSSMKAREAIGALVQEANDALEQAMSKRTSKAVFLNLTDVSRNSKAGSPDAQFLSALNQQIREQVAGKQSADYPSPLLLPLVIVRSVEDLPDLFVDAVVTSVGLEDEQSLAGKSLRFSIYNPGFGILISGHDCFNVDMRVSDAENRFFSYTTVGKLKHDWAENINANSVAIAAEQRFFYARPPLRAPYYLYVQVGGSRNRDDWDKAVPVITDFQLTLLGYIDRNYSDNIVYRSVSLFARCGSNGRVCFRSNETSLAG